MTTFIFETINHAHVAETLNANTRAYDDLSVRPELDPETGIVHFVCLPSCLPMLEDTEEGTCYVNCSIEEFQRLFAEYVHVRD